MSHVAAAFVVLFSLSILARADDSGVFADQKDVGVLLHRGSSLFDLQSRIYTLYASGENMWAAKDAFHFRFTKASGDLSLSADVSFLEAGTDKHRKACLMFRQDLDPDSAYIDVALHGDGLTSLQFREAKGGLTHEIQSAAVKPKHLRLEKRGNTVYLFLGSSEERQFSGASHRIALAEPFYVGLALCSHNKDITESATFSNVELNTKPAKIVFPTIYSTLETQSIASTDRRVVFTMPMQLMEAPAWTLDGGSLLFTSLGNRYVISATAPAATPRGTSVSAFGLESSDTSPDGKRRLLVSSSNDRSMSTLSLLTVASNKTDILAELSAFHGLSNFPCWSPDSRKIAFISYHLLQ